MELRISCVFTYIDDDVDCDDNDDHDNDCDDDDAL